MICLDHVSKYLLLKHLIKLCISGVIFNAMRAMYMVTRCVLKGFGKLLEIIEMYKRIKQGAPPSMILSMIFMDDLVETLKRKCIVKPILYDLIFYYMHMILKCSIVNCLWKNVLIEAITEKKRRNLTLISILPAVFLIVLGPAFLLQPTVVYLF